MKKAVWIFLLIMTASAAAAGSIFVLNFEDSSIYAPIGIIGAGLLITFLFRPFWGYLFFTLTLPLQSEEYALLEFGGAVIRVADVIALPVFLGWIFSACFIKKEGLPLRKTGFELPLLLFSSFVVLSILWSTDLPSSISKLLQLIYAIILFYMSSDLIKTKKDLILVFWAWLLAGTFLAGTTVYDSLASSARGASDFAANSLVTGELLNYPSFLGIGFILALRGIWPRVTAFVLTAACASALIATGSRGPILGFAGAILYIVLASPSLRKPLRLLPSLGVAALVVFAAWAVVLNVGVIELAQDSMARFIQLIEDPMSDTGVRYRVALWSAAWELFVRFPIIGIGIGSLTDRLTKYVPVELGHPTVLHCLYLEMLLLLGFLGFLVFAWLFIRMAKFLWQTRREVGDPSLKDLLRGVIAALIAQGIGWLTYGKFIENRVFWVCLALAVAISRLAPEPRQAEHVPHFLLDTGDNILLEAGGDRGR
ncbi:MAG: O-antigen ligase family protein [Desulfobacteraceae bacterium]|jgi:hypothetical protein